jgi:hypothetical protein
MVSKPEPAGPRPETRLAERSNTPTAHFQSAFFAFYTAWITCCIEELSWQIGKRSCDFKTLEPQGCDSLWQNNVK